MRKTLKVRFVGDHQQIEQLIASMCDQLKRDGYELAKQPCYKQSRKKSTITIVYTKWIFNPILTPDDSFFEPENYIVCEQDYPNEPDGKPSWYDPETDPKQFYDSYS